MKMKMSREGIAELASREGCILTPYYDTANPPVKTVGFGSTVSDIPELPNWPWDKTLTLQEALNYFLQGLVKYQTAVNKALKKDVKLTQAQFDALVSITYNIGVGGMQKSTFIKLINSGCTTKAVCDAIMMWNKPASIVKRRQSEVNMYQNSVYTRKGICDMNTANPSTHREHITGKTINLLDYI